MPVGNRSLVWAAGTTIRALSARRAHRLSRTAGGIAWDAAFRLTDRAQPIPAARLHRRASARSHQDRTHTASVCQELPARQGLDDLGQQGHPRRGTKYGRLLALGTFITPTRQRRTGSSRWAQLNRTGQVPHRHLSGTKVFMMRRVEWATSASPVRRGLLDWLVRRWPARRSLRRARARTTGRT